jgi:hypothetical protein
MTTKKSAETAWNEHMKKIPPEVRPAMPAEFYAGFRAGIAYEKDLVVLSFSEFQKKYKERV